MKAMILAAGRGERMRPLTDNCPKPMLPVAGKPLIVWHIERLAAAGFTDVIINHAHLGQMLVEGLGNGDRWGLRLQYSPESPALETAGGIRQALPRLGSEAFVVINGDIYCDWPFALAPLIAAELDPTALAHLVMVPNPPHHPKGDFVLLNDQLRPDESVGERLTFAGIGVYRPALFDQLLAGHPQKLAPLLQTALMNGQVRAERYDGYWLDVGTPARLAELSQRLEAG